MTERKCRMYIRAASLASAKHKWVEGCKLFFNAFNATLWQFTQIWVILLLRTPDACLKTSLINTFSALPSTETFTMCLDALSWRLHRWLFFCARCCLYFKNGRMVFPTVWGKKHISQSCSKSLQHNLHPTSPLRPRMRSTSDTNSDSNSADYVGRCYFLFLLFYFCFLLHLSHSF